MIFTKILTINVYRISYLTKIKYGSLCLLVWMDVRQTFRFIENLVNRSFGFIENSELWKRKYYQKVYIPS
jgi:hypothetical protein